MGRNNLSIREQFKPVGGLFKLAQRIATLCDKFIRSPPGSLSATLAALPCMSLASLAPFRFATPAICLTIICTNRRARTQDLFSENLCLCAFRYHRKHSDDAQCEMFCSISQIFVILHFRPNSAFLILNSYFSLRESFKTMANCELDGETNSGKLCE